MPPRETKPKRPRKQRTARQRWVLRVSYLCYIGVLLYGGARLFFWVRYERDSPIPVTGVERVWRHHYQELWSEGALEAQPSLDDDRYDVLLLGGSVAEQVQDELEVELQAHSSQKVRVYSVSRAAHNSRDSYNKFTRLTDNRFDCVIVYHGINDVPMNYVAESQFKDDYTHCGWYATFKLRVAAGDISIGDISHDLVETIGREPDIESLKFGDKIKTGQAFRRNLQFIAQHAKQNGSTVVLMSFASYVPTNYTYARFRAGELDYSEGAFDIPVEKWGRREDIAPIMAVHNQAARQVADEIQTVWVDQAALLQGPAYFCDVCHLSPAGCEQFARNTVAAIRAQSALE